MSRPRTEGREVTLAPPDGFERCDYVRDLRVGDVVQVVGRKSWTTVTILVNQWYVWVRDRPNAPEKLVVRAKLIDGARRRA